MSEEEEAFCRLCAEPTLKTNLISPEEEVGAASMLVTKMLWINIDVSSSIILPNMICFSCFDQLERTYRFLNTVRSAQLKLHKIFVKKDDDVVKIDSSEEDAGKPVDMDWDEFQKVKPEIKEENDEDEVEISAVAVATDLLIEIGMDSGIKTERGSYEDNLIHSDGFKTSDDEDVPLVTVAKKKKSTKKIKCNENIDNSSGVLSSFTWDNYTWRCGNCDALFQNVQSLRIHSIQIHSVCCVFKCNDCSKNSSNFKLFVKHVREHIKLLRYCCEYCNKRFNRSTCLKKHYIKHKDNLYLTCENCGSNFDSAEELQDHIIIFTKGYKRKMLKEEVVDLKCEVCDKEFKSRSNLQQHKLVHTKRSRDFSCHVCGKMFFTKGTLSTHIMTHQDVRPYKCEHCSMSFRARGNLQSHISLHSGAKPFVCEQCGKSFRVKRLLKSHYIVHTDLMPFICEFCNKTFRFKTRLNLHLRQHTGAKPYNCVYCQRDFTNGSNFKKHMKRRHNIDTSKKNFFNIVREENTDDTDTVILS